MHKKEELISRLLELKLNLHRSEQNIRELIDLVNDLSLKKENKMDYNRIRKERRFKILSFDYDEILELLMVPSDHYTRIKRIKLPDDFYADSVHYDPSNRSFDFVIGCEKFPSISQFVGIPYCNEEIKYSVIELNQKKDFRVIDKNCEMQE